MVVYMIFTQVRTIEPAALKIYSSLVKPTLAGHAVKALSTPHSKFEVLEGSKENEGVAVLEFPTTEAAKKWYYGAEYQAAAEHRKKGSDYNVVLIEGLEQ